MSDVGGPLRRPVAAFSDPAAHVVCDDGSVWSFEVSRAGLCSWSEEEPIPGTARANELGANIKVPGGPPGTPTRTVDPDFIRP